MVRYRYPISGPSGVIAYKEQITNATFFANAVNRQSEYTIAGMKFDQSLNQILSRPSRNPIVFVGSVVGAGKNFFSGISHEIKGFSLDPKNQEKILIAIFFIFSFGFVIILFNSYPRRKLEKMIVGGTKQRRLKTCAYLRLPLLSGARKKCHSNCSIGAMTPEESSTSLKGFFFFDSTLLKNTARILILAMLFQGGLVFAPLTLNAQEIAESASPCSATYYPLFDHLGTAIILLDETGNVVYEQHYAPFGQKDEAHSSKKPSSCNNGESKDPFPYGFTGHFGDDESGLIYMGARYYNPAIGHFLTPDNVLPSPTDSLSYDRYAYTRNNPINLIDPTGNFFWAPIIGAVVGGIIAGMSDENIVLGMATGAASGALFGAASGHLLGTIGAGFASGAMNSAVYGGDVLRGAIVGAITAGIGYGIGQAGSSISPNIGKMGMGAVSAISGGIVGGLGSIAMGGSFGEGFKVGFISAGLSYAAGEIAAMITEGGTYGGDTETDTRKALPTKHIKSGEKILIAYTEYDPATIEKNSATGQEIKLENLIEKDANRLADILEGRGVKVVTKEYNSWESFKGDFNAAEGQWNHVILLSHNLNGEIPFSASSIMPLGGIAELSNKTILPGGSLMLASCFSGKSTSSNYLLGSQVAPAMYGSTSAVKFSAIIFWGKNYYSPGPIKGDWVKIP
jgi:RHS repeat-associated protein